MATIENPVINKAVREKVRPLAEKARGLFILGQAMLPDAAAILTALAGADDADVIAEGREAEGIPSLTVGQLRASIGLLQDLVTDAGADQRLPAVLAACVRPLHVE